MPFPYRHRKVYRHDGDAGANQNLWVPLMPTGKIQVGLETVVRHHGDIDTEQLHNAMKLSFWFALFQISIRQQGQVNSCCKAPTSCCPSRYHW